MMARPGHLLEHDAAGPMDDTRPQPLPAGVSSDPGPFGWYPRPLAQEPERGRQAGVMTTRIDFAVLVRLVLKLSGLVLVILALVGLSTALLAGLAAMVDDQGFPGPGNLVFLYGATPVILLIAGLVLWLFPTPIANTVVADASPDDGTSPDWTQRLQNVLLLALGLYFIIDGISGVAYEGVYQYVMTEATQMPMTRNGRIIASIAGNAVRIALGLFLVLGRHGLVAALQRLRESGLHDARK
ncbi:MAG: hypothetical protein RQ847_11570 [Wenzhouxiangellaceae bacterium]|nr:hypothetical protein [Wenzhouxiangellaceae bacterium]